MVVVVVVIECFFVPFCSLHTLTLLCDETFLCSCRLLFSTPHFFWQNVGNCSHTLSLSRVLALFYYYWILGMVVVVVVRTFTHYYTSFLQVLVRFAATAFAAAAAAATPTTTSTASTTNALSFFLPHSHASSSCIRLPFRPLSSVTEQSPRR